MSLKTWVRQQRLLLRELALQPRGFLLRHRIQQFVIRQQTHQIRRRTDCWILELPNYQILNLSYIFTFWLMEAFWYLLIDAQSFSNPFEGVHGVVIKVLEGVLYFRVLLHFYVTIFQSLLRGYMRCPPPPPSPPPPCVHQEGVGTSKIRTSKGQNVKSIFWMIRTSKVKRSERQKSNYTFDVLIFLDAIGKIRTSKIKKINYLWRITYVYHKVCGGLV